MGSTTERSQVPSSILIIGSGVFGLSTALALSSRPSFASTQITVLDRSTFPSPDGSSIDSSRIVRADYSDAAYASLGALAQCEWRKQSAQDLGGEGRYSENGLVLVANTAAQGSEYVKKSFVNVLAEAKVAGDPKAVEELPTREAIDAAVGIGGGSGDWGYINNRSGWADAEASMRWLRTKAQMTDRIKFITAEVISLLISSSKKVLGANLKDGSQITADLTILAAGAWSSALIDLRGRCQATGQVLSYLTISDGEQARLGKMPVLLNMSTGMFIIPPRGNVLKVARHGYGYSNPTPISHPEDSSQGIIQVSLPRTSWDDPSISVPTEGYEACQRALSEMIPSLSERTFHSTRICWYSDTPNGDFLIDYHPAYSGSLFLATGGSGHGFKFLPVIGEKIVDCIEGNCPVEFRNKWMWRTDAVENCVTEDGSRGGEQGMVLDEELKR